MRGSLLDASDEGLAQYLWNRKGTVCTMCRVFMPEGYCTCEQCETYPKTLGAIFIARFIAAVNSTHSKFKRHTSLKPTHSKTVSGGRVESKRRKH